MNGNNEYNRSQNLGENQTTEELGKLVKSTLREALTDSSLPASLKLEAIKMYLSYIELEHTETIPHTTAPVHAAAYVDVEDTENCEDTTDTTGSHLTHYQTRIFGVLARHPQIPMSATEISEILGDLFERPNIQVQLKRMVNTGFVEKVDRGQYAIKANPHITSERLEIIQLLQHIGKPLTAPEIASVMGKNYNTTRIILRKMHGLGLLSRDNLFRYFPG